MELFRYDNFLEDQILEKVLKDSVLFFTPEMLKVLYKIKDETPIAKKLLDTESSDIKPDITFIDVVGDGTTATFTTMKNAVATISKSEDISRIIIDGQFHQKEIADRIWSRDKKLSSDDRKYVYSSKRNEIRMGRLVNRVFPGEFNDKAVEEFVNKYKAVFEQLGEHFEIVEGDKIAKYYSEVPLFSNSGQLASSCMGGKSSKTFDIYTKNPEVCRMLILVEDDRLKGRALIWKPESIKNIYVGPGTKPELNFEFFLDRQYTISDTLVEKFRMYAKEKGWAYKTVNNHHNSLCVTYNGQDLNLEMAIRLKECSPGSREFDYDRYPYMDTFKLYNPNTGVLYNECSDDPDPDVYSGYYFLESTMGSYTEVSYNDDDD